MCAYVQVYHLKRENLDEEWRMPRQNRVILPDCLHSASNSMDTNEREWTNLLCIREAVIRLPTTVPDLPYYAHSLFGIISVPT